MEKWQNRLPLPGIFGEAGPYPHEKQLVKADS